MSEEKKSRTSQEIQQEFNGLALKLGDIVYKLAMFDKDKTTIVERMRDLGFEYLAAKNAEEKADADKPKESTSEQAN